MLLLWSTTYLVVYHLLRFLGATEPPSQVRVGRATYRPGAEMPVEDVTPVLVGVALKTRCADCGAPRGELCRTDEDFLVHRSRVAKAHTKLNMKVVA